MSLNGPLYCYNHPQRQTYLRCNQCERPICSSCAMLTPTGYRCKECVRGQQKKFDTTRWWDYPVTVIVALVLSIVFDYLINSVRLMSIFLLILAPVAGMIIAAAVRFAVRKRRSRNLPYAATISTFVGGILFPIITIIYLFVLSPGAGLSSLLSLIWPIAYAILSAITVFYRLKGIRL